MRKRSLLLLFTLLLFIMSGPAQAAIADRFDCHLHYAPTPEARGVEADAELTAVRRALVAPSTAAVSYTEGQAGASVSAQSERFQAAFQLVYLHAVKRAPSGQIVRAAQHVCLSYTYLVGEKGVSADCRPTCEDAFDPKCKWAKVAVHDGVPVFDPKGLSGLSQPLPQGGQLALSCRYQGTLE